MSAETNKAVVRHLNEELNARRLDVLDAHPSMAPMKSFFQQLFAAFPDGQVTVQELFAEGDWVACRMTERGTHQGTWIDVPATGRTVEWEIIATYRFADGKIVETHAQADNLSLLRQIGALPVPVRA